MLIEEIDSIDPEALERSVGDLLNVLGSAVESWKGIHVEAEFRSDNHLSTEWGQGFADKLFVGEWPVGFSGVEECNTAFDRRPDQ